MKKRILFMLVLLLMAATGAWADESSESFTTTSGAASYTGEHFKISVDNVGDGEGFFLEEATGARIEALNGEIITKVEFTQGYYDITRLRSGVGTTTYEGEVATVSGVNATSLTVNADIGLQIKAVKVYYTSESSESFTTNSGASSYTGEHFNISLVDGGDEDGFYLGESDYASIEALNGEIITKVEFTQGGWSITDLRSAVGTTTYEGEVATVSGVNATSLTVNAANTLQIKAVKVYYTTGPATAPAGYTVSLKDGTEDADKWTGKVGAATDYQALPLNVVEGAAVSLKFDGTKRVKSVKAVVKAAEPAVKPVTLAEATVGMVVGSDGNAYAVADKDNLPKGVTAAGMVAYKSGSNGLVIALADEASTMNWSTANGTTTGAAAHTPTVTGQTWKLPSEDEWKQMFNANGSNENSCAGLNTAIGNAGGTALQKGYYWSSDEFYEEGEYVVRYVQIYNDNASFYVGGKTPSDHVRACLAF